MHQSLVITVFVERIELQIAVQKQRISRFSFGDDDALIRRTFRVNYIVGKQRIFGERRQIIGFDERDEQ